MPGRPEASAEPDWSRIKETFEAALRCPPDERDAFLRGACGADEALRGEVATLLAAHDEAGALPGAARRRRGPIPRGVGHRSARTGCCAEIGRGGMGAVYRAVREDDAFQQGRSRSSWCAAPERTWARRRFRRERQILARLAAPEHRGPLRRRDLDEGQPYLVMELVEGEPLDRYCESRGLGLRERLALFRTICAAVHHAHQAAGRAPRPQARQHPGHRARARPSCSTSASPSCWRPRRPARTCPPRPCFPC